MDRVSSKQGRPRARSWHQQNELYAWRSSLWLWPGPIRSSQFLVYAQVCIHFYPMHWDASGLPPLAPRELPRASAFAGVHLVRLWDTGVIRNVGSAAAVVGCSSARGDHESSASPLPCECQRHRQERKCVALCITCLAVRSKYPSGPASRSTPAPKPFDGISLCENHVRRAGLMTATSGFSCWETSVAVSPFPEGKIGKIAL